MTAQKTQYVVAARIKASRDDPVDLGLRFLFFARVWVDKTHTVVRRTFSAKQSVVCAICSIILKHINLQEQSDLACSATSCVLLGIAEIHEFKANRFLENGIYVY